jgi:hypothetical protein
MLGRVELGIKEWPGMEYLNSCLGLLVILAQAESLTQACLGCKEDCQNEMPLVRSERYRNTAVFALAFPIYWAEAPLQLTFTACLSPNNRLLTTSRSDSPTDLDLPITEINHRQLTHLRQLLRASQLSQLSQQLQQSRRLNNHSCHGQKSSLVCFSQVAP